MTHPIKRLAIVASVIAVSIAVLAPTVGDAARTASSPSPPKAPVCSPEHARARLSASLNSLRSVGWKLTDEATNFLAGTDLSLITGPGDGRTALVKLAVGGGKALPVAMNLSYASGKARTNVRSLARATGHEVVNYYCSYGSPAYMQYWTGPTSTTYINFLFRHTTGAEGLNQTPIRSCSAPEAPCMFLGSGNPPSDWFVVTGVYFARYATHQLINKWCSY